MKKKIQKQAWLYNHFIIFFIYIESMWKDILLVEKKIQNQAWLCNHFIIFFIYSRYFNLILQYKFIIIFKKVQWSD